MLLACKRQDHSRDGPHRPNLYRLRPESATIVCLILEKSLLKKLDNDILDDDDILDNRLIAGHSFGLKSSDKLLV